MIDINKIESLLDDMNVDYVHQNGSLKCKCFLCGDSQKSNRTKRLKITPYYTYDTWMCYCWNGGCECKGMDIISLYSKVKGISYTKAKKIVNNDVYDVNKIKDRLKTKKTKKQDIKNNTDINIPNECMSVDTEPIDRFQKRYVIALQEFIFKRNIPKQYNCYVAYSGKYQGRIIIPVFIKDKLMYFQGRSIFDNIKPKYLNPVVDKTGIILNSDRFNRDKSIIVTEGIIDAWMVEYNQGTSCLGSYFNDSLIKRLLKMTDKDVILCFDNPLIDKAGHEEIMNFMSDSIYKSKVKYFIPDTRKFKDLNDIKVAQPNINIYDYVIGNIGGLYQTSAKMKLLHKYIM